MARGYCPNQECPNIDILDTVRPCPTCGREPRELTPREYWRTRTIKMMHEHETAQISEIQEVARRALGEASFVSRAQEAEQTSRGEELEGPDEAGSVDLAEPSLPAMEALGGDVVMGYVEMIGEVEEVPLVEGVIEPEATAHALESESAESESREPLRTDLLHSVSENEDEVLVPSSETGKAETPELRESEQVRSETLEEVSSPTVLPVGVDQPASPVRIITFREGGTEIGICPYCGRFIRGGDMRRHKLKCRVRNALGLQDEG